MAKSDAFIEQLGQVLEKSLKRIDPSGRLAEYGVWPIWNDLVGDIIARNAQPEKIRNGTLFVKVSSHVWMQQLQYMKDTITDKVNEKLEREVVKNIFFYVGEVTAPVPEVSAGNNIPAAQAPAVLGEETLQSVKDPEIRRALNKLFAAHARRRKA
ncbi:MAG TPA: DUF721 domain-containing protein [Candidatus Binatia bacterium]|jgi:predicted nucleic acid-binding Zn ribbon protein